MTTLLTPAQQQWKTEARKAAWTKLRTKFMLVWKSLHGPTLHEEYRFTPDRLWRFDFAFDEPLVRSIAMQDNDGRIIRHRQVVPVRIAIEVQGGTYMGYNKKTHAGKHSSGVRQTNDFEKNNAAQALGWHLFYLDTKMITSRHLEPIVKLCQ